MARHESDREDLMREATALKRRVRLQPPAGGPMLVAGFHRDGALSLYFEADPVYHFDSAGLLKRAYIDGDLYRTQGETLAKLTRVRSDRETQLIRIDLTPDECDRVRKAVINRLTGLHDSLAAGSLQAVETVPSGDPIVPDLLSVIGLILRQEIRLAPAFPGRV